ncbi:GNAT family N-acetyltransferase [Kitasatospora sp. NPDC048296]|uniref:GNAT family N-acetyltransferase n=1 Tax=Kitasatospora sp. NPDC048296 TaxID=3364048 RepID=UPI0037125E14
MSTVMTARHPEAQAPESVAAEIVYESFEYAPHRLTHGFAAEGCHGVSAVTTDGVRVGSLLWDREDGMVWWVGVREKWRRSGIATAMWRLAVDKADTLGWTRPVHSDVLTPYGRAWIDSL